MRILILLTAICIGVFVAEFGSALDQPPATHRVRRVALYVTNWKLSRTTIDLKSGKAAVFRKIIGIKPKTWRMTEMDLSRPDQNRVEQLVQASKLRRFRPSSKWFGVCPQLDVGSVLLIAWEDRQVAFAIPPKSMRAHLPRPARQRYAEIDRLASYAVDLHHRCLKNGVSSDFSADSKEAKSYEADLDRVIEASLPKKRVGW